MSFCNLAIINSSLTLTAVIPCGNLGNKMENYLDIEGKTWVTAVISVFFDWLIWPMTKWINIQMLANK